MTSTTRESYRGNICNPAKQPISTPHLPSFERIQRFCYPGIPLATNPYSSSDKTEQDSRIPPLGNLEAYGIDVGRQRSLWDLEIQRLQQLNFGVEECLQPRIDSNDSFLGDKMEQGVFEDLESLARTIHYALLVCVIDDAVVAYPILEESSPFARECYQTLLRFHRREGEPQVPGLYRGSARSPYIHRKRLQQVSRSNFYYLVDQITATLAQVAIRVSESEYWLVVLLSCLAKLGTKMKVIHSDLLRSIGISVDGAAQWPFEERGFGFDQPKRNLSLNDDSPIVERHVREHINVSSWLAKCIITVLHNLGDQKPWWKENHCVESCTLMFDAGLNATRTLLYQNNNGRISGSDDKIALSFSSAALETVWKLSDMITSRTREVSLETSTNEPPTAWVELHLDLEENNEGRRRCSQPSLPTKLHRTIDYIILVIPLSLTDPLIGEEYRSTLKLISSLSAFGVQDITRKIQIHGFVALKLDKQLAPGTNSRLEGHSATHETAKSVKSDFAEGLEFQTSSPLLGSFLLRKWRCHLNRRAIQEPENSQPEGIFARLKCKPRRQNKSREEILAIAGTWAVQEKAIVVPCPKYVISVGFLTVFLVAGGMACAFAVGERISGVDPFNLTNFSWLVGGLSILVAKSMRVSSWTWRDFLSGRVSCRTVQELSDVSGLEPQDILLFLLSTEMHAVLLTGGPFQKAFAKHPDSDGFSIDVKPNLETLLASGIVLVDVLTLEGPALIWLRMVPGYRGLKSVYPSCASHKSWFRVCMNPPRAQEGGDAIITDEYNFGWMKILGLYNLRDVEFR